MKSTVKNKGGTLILFVLLSALFFPRNACSQPVVALDNWFNREIHPRTGIPYHYLWTDTEFSGYSEWGRIFKARGAVITTIEKPLRSVLNDADVYIIVDPDTITESVSPNYILPVDIRVIKRWVRKGGVLAIFANDGPNCEFTHLNKLASKFGIRFNHVSLYPVTNNDWEMGAITNLPDHPLFRGVSKIYLKEISDMKLKRQARPVLTAGGRVLMAENDFGKGYVFAVGDPWLYNEYIDHALLPESFENLKAAKNLTDLLLEKTGKKARE